MRQRKSGGLARFVAASAPSAARRLFLKARLAGDVASGALDSRGRRLAREVKDRLLEAALRVDPALFRRFPDPRAGRWIYCMRSGGSMHGRKMDAGA